MEAASDAFVVSGAGLDCFEAATARLNTRGFTVVRFGPGASLPESEQVVRPLLGLGDASSGGQYNGAGGLMRQTLGGSNFLDAGVGGYAELPIEFHNEMAYATAFPRTIAFAMAQQAEFDGATLLVDNVELTRRLSEALRRKMAAGVRYVRMLHPAAACDDVDYYNSWEGAFQTTDLTKAYGRVRAAGGVLEPMADGKRLRHTLWSPVFCTHPAHGELYFSSILNRHGSWLSGHAHFGTVPFAERPYHCVWADGTELSATELTELRAVHAECTQRVQLANGDVLIIDNLRVAHGRTPWAGSVRKMGLLLSDLVDREAHRQLPACFLEWVSSLDGREAAAARL